MPAVLLKKYVAEAARLMPDPAVLGRIKVVRRVFPPALAEGTKDTFASEAGKSVARVQQGRTSIAVTSGPVTVNPSRLTTMDDAVLDEIRKYVPERFPEVTSTK